MKPNELRIGSIISYHGLRCFVLGIHPDNKLELGYFKDSTGFTRDINDEAIKPILLTGEFLLTIGAKTDKSIQEDWNYILHINKTLALCFYISHTSYFSILKDGNYIPFNFDNIKYLHLLQDFYFLLSKKELNYK